PDIRWLYSDQPLTSRGSPGVTYTGQRGFIAGTNPRRSRRARGCEITQAEDRDPRRGPSRASSSATRATSSRGAVVNLLLPPVMAPALLGLIWRGRREEPA